MAPQKGPGQFDGRISCAEAFHHNYAVQKSRLHESFSSLAGLACSRRVLGRNTSCMCFAWD